MSVDDDDDDKVCLERSSAWGSLYQPNVYYDFRMIMTICSRSKLFYTPLHVRFVRMISEKYTIRKAVRTDVTSHEQKRAFNQLRVKKNCSNNISNNNNSKNTFCLVALLCNEQLPSSLECTDSVDNSLLFDIGAPLSSRWGWWMCAQNRDKPIRSRGGRVV